MMSLVSFTPHPLSDVRPEQVKPGLRVTAHTLHDPADCSKSFSVRFGTNEQWLEILSQRYRVITQCQLPGDHRELKYKLRLGPALPPHGCIIAVSAEGVEEVRLIVLDSNRKKGCFSDENDYTLRDVGEQSVEGISMRELDFTYPLFCTTVFRHA